MSIRSRFFAGEMTENIAEIPVVQEQVIVQEIPDVIVPLPPVEEVSAPVYDHVHQEQIAASEMTVVAIQWRTRWSRHEKAAATTQTVASARTSERRCGPGRESTPRRPTETGHGQGRGGSTS